MKQTYPIDVEKLIYNILSKMKNNLSRQIGEDASYTLVIQVLLREHYSIPRLEDEISRIEDRLKEKELDYNKLDKEHKEFMKELLLKDNKPVFMGMSLQPGHQGPYSPPPPPSKPKEIIDLSKLKTTNDVKKDVKAEMKAVFNGDIRKPSEIAKLTKPKHLESKII